jgi:hypothetical protein
MKNLTIGLSLAALTLAGGALAAPDAAGLHAGKAATRAEAQARAAAMFDRIDANRDRKLDQADRAAHQGQVFDRIDADHNGAISRDEFAAMHQRGAKHRPGMADAGPGSGGMKHGRMGGGHRMGGKLVDADGDGTLTRAEFIAGALKRFDAADADHNGTVTPEERQAGHGRMKAGWWGKRGADAPPPPPGA